MGLFMVESRRRLAIISILVLVFLAACSKEKLNYADRKEPSDKPEYTVQIEPNKAVTAQ